MHVTIVAGYDAAGSSAGGTRAYAEGLARFLSTERIPHLLVSGGSGGHVAEDRFEIPIPHSGSGLSFQAAVYAHVSSLPIPRDTIVHTQRPETLLPFAVGRRRDARIVTLHGNPAQAIRNRRGRLVGAFYRLVERVALRGAHHVISVDVGTGREYTRRYRWLNNRLTVIPNGVDSSLFRVMDRTDAKRKWGIEDTAFLYAGRLEPEKRVLEIVRAFRSLKGGQAVLLIAGDGRQRAAIEAAARGLPVRLLGDVPRSDIPSLLSASDAVVLFSVREGLPMVALEALTCGTPVIATPVGDLPKVVRHGETGFLVSSASDLEHALRAVVNGSLQPSPSIANSVSTYNWKEIGGRILPIYEEVWNARAH